MRKLWIVLFFTLVSVCSGEQDRLERNKNIARQVIEEVLGKGRFDLVDRLYAPDFINHGRTRDVDLAVDQAAAHGWRQAFPDLTMNAELLVAEGDLVAVLWRGAGTNTGEGNGLPATGKSGQGRGITIWRVKDGRITEEWSEFGMLDMMRQLGLIPGETDPEPDTRPHVFTETKEGVSNEEREQNRKIARTLFEQIVGEGKLDLFDSICSSGFVNHGTYQDSNLQGEVEGARDFRKLAPDLRVKIEQTIAEGDLVAVLYGAQGTNAGAATGKPFNLRGISILRINNGKITEEWSMLDQYATLEQLGLISKPGENQTE